MPFPLSHRGSSAALRSAGRVGDGARSPTRPKLCRAAVIMARRTAPVAWKIGVFTLLSPDETWLPGVVTIKGSRQKGTTISSGQEKAYSSHYSIDPHPETSFLNPP